MVCRVYRKSSSFLRHSGGDDTEGRICRGFTTQVSRDLWYKRKVEVALPVGQGRPSSLGIDRVTTQRGPRTEMMLAGGTRHLNHKDSTKTRAFLSPSPHHENI